MDRDFIESALPYVAMLSVCAFPSLVILLFVLFF